MFYLILVLLIVVLLSLLLIKLISKHFKSKVKIVLNIWVMLVAGFSIYFIIFLYKVAWA